MGGDQRGTESESSSRYEGVEERGREDTSMGGQ